MFNQLMEKNLLDENEALRRQIAELQAKIDERKHDEYGIVADDLFEYLIIARTEAMDEKINDMLKFTQEAYRKAIEKDETVRRILEFFPGRTAFKKKEQLREFIIEHPSFRTTDPKLLLQRLRLYRKYSDTFSKEPIPLQPIKEAIERSNTPPPIPEHKDEDFLE